jgi:hypothetical protein
MQTLDYLIPKEKRRISAGRSAAVFAPAATAFVACLPIGLFYLDTYWADIVMFTVLLAAEIPMVILLTRWHRQLAAVSIITGWIIAFIGGIFVAFVGAMTLMRIGGVW